MGRLTAPSAHGTPSTGRFPGVEGVVYNSALLFGGMRAGRPQSDLWRLTAGTWRGTARHVRCAVVSRNCLRRREEWDDRHLDRRRWGVLRGCPGLAVSVVAQRSVQIPAIHLHARRPGTATRKAPERRDCMQVVTLGSQCEDVYAEAPELPFTSVPRAYHSAAFVYKCAPAARLVGCATPHLMAVSTGAKKSSEALPGW